MFAKELVGKTCIRETPVIKERYIQGGGLFYGEVKVKEPDYTYCTDAVKIIAATDHNIVAESENLFGNPVTVILDERYCDDAWIDYNALIGGTENVPEE